MNKKERSIDDVAALIRLSLEATPLGPGRLRAAWRRARAEMMASMDDEPLRVAMALGTGAVDPGDDPVTVTPSPLGGALSALLGALALRLAGVVVSGLFGSSGESLALPLSLAGAAGGVWLCLARFDDWRRIVKLATVASAASAALPWRGRGKRLSLALWGGAFLWATRPRVRFDMDEASRRLTLALDAELQSLKSTSRSNGPSNDTSLEDLWPALCDLARSGEATGPASAALLEVARGLGLPGLVGEPRIFRWDEGSDQLYDAFGLVGRGELVREERPPLVRDGRTVRRGLARRVGA